MMSPAVCVPAGATYDIVIPADPGVLAVRIELDWIGLDWVGLNWIGLD